MQEGLGRISQLPQHQDHVGVGVAIADVPDLVGDVGAVADGLACLGGPDLVANGNLHLAFQQIEVFHGSGRMRVGFQEACWLCLKISKVIKNCFGIPLLMACYNNRNFHFKLHLRQN